MKYIDFGFPQEKFNVIDNIFDNNFYIDHTSDFEEPYQLLYAGRLSEEKGVRNLPEIIYRLCEDTPKDYKLTIAGDGPLLSVLKMQISGRGLGDYVEFYGHVPYNQMPEIYAAHDMLIYPVEWEEPFGRIFLEALGAGTPIVAFDVGAASRIIGGGGKTVNKDIDSLVKAIRNISSRSILSELSTACKQQIADYRSERIIPRCETLYNEVI
jgi:glycosyltransferase involved in cell wall biosynthesis